MRKKTFKIRFGDKLVRVLALIIFLNPFFPAMIAWAGNPSIPVTQPSDIQEHWSQVQIRDWFDRGLVKGYEDGTFRPDNAITRAEFLSMANHGFNFTIKAHLDFTDVAPTDWYAREVAIARAAGYITGYEDSTFHPNGWITRQEVAAMLARILKLSFLFDPDQAGKFADSLFISQWSRGFVYAVVDAGYMVGYPDNTFKATQFITRAEALVALDRALRSADNK